MKFSIEETAILNFTLQTIKKPEYEELLSGLETDDPELKEIIGTLVTKIEDMENVEFGKMAIDRQLMHLTTFPLYERPIIAKNEKNS